VFKLKKATFQELFYTELIELLNDEELMVRLEAIDALVDIMPQYLLAD